MNMEVVFHTSIGRNRKYGPGQGTEPGSNCGNHNIMPHPFLYMSGQVLVCYLRQTIIMSIKGTYAERKEASNHEKQKSNIWLAPFSGASFIVYKISILTRQVCNLFQEPME